MNVLRRRGRERGKVVFADDGVFEEDPALEAEVVPGAAGESGVELRAGEGREVGREVGHGGGGGRCAHGQRRCQRCIR